MDHFVNLENAHICVIWALLILLLSVAVILIVAILQGGCIGHISKSRMICDWIFVICDSEPMKLMKMGGVYA